MPSSDHEYAFSLYESKNMLKSVVIYAGGVPLSVIVDTEAICNRQVDTVLLEKTALAHLTNYCKVFQRIAAKLKSVCDTKLR